MALTELTANLNIIQSLSDQPALSADELKQNFDAGANSIKTYINETLLPELNTLITNLQNGNSSTVAIVNNLKSIVTEISTKVDNLKSGANTKITIGSSVPTSLEDGEVYLQYFG